MFSSIRLVLFVALISALGCVAPAVGAPGGNKAKTDQAVSDSAAQAARASTVDFGGRLYEHLAQEPGNIALSPASISPVMMMVSAAGMQGTDTDIRNALGMGFAEKPHDDFRELLGQWRDEPTLEVVNRLWHARGISPSDISDNFRLTMEDNYFAPVGAASSSVPSEWVAEVNSWVEENTKGMIQDLIPNEAVDERTSLIWANASYFKGDWASAFDPCDTTDGEFRVPGRSTPASVRMMKQMSYFKVAQIDGGTLVELPYVGDTTVMDIILPDEGASLDGQVVSQLGSWLAKADEARQSLVALTMPQFELPSGNTLDIGTPLAAMGVPFEGASHLGAAFVDGRKEELQRVFHQAVVRVDELGTTAAAGTAAIGGTRSALPPVPREINVDRSFIFVIRHLPTGAVTFLGRIDEPPALEDPPQCER